MAITVGVDGYVTEAELLAHAELMGWTAIAALDTAEHEKLIKRTTIYLDQSYKFKGEITEADQGLAWPRSGVIDKEGREIGSTEYPAGLKYASFEGCNIAHSGALVAADTEGKVKQTKAGSVSVTFVDSNVASEGARMRPITRALAGLYVRAPGKRGLHNRPLLKA